MSKCWGLDPSSRGSDIEESLAWLWWTSAGLEKETTCKGKKNLCFTQSVLTLRGPNWPQREKVMSVPPCYSRFLSTVLQHSRLNHQVEMRTQRRNFLFLGGRVAAGGGEAYIAREDLKDTVLLLTLSLTDPRFHYNLERVKGVMSLPWWLGR